MNITSHTGLYGKLPAHGDFVQRNLPSGFIASWDDWMQHFIAGTREQIGEDWLNIYLTSPIWRFVFSQGVIDADAWAGIILPSVDRVGRYFPFSVVTRLPNNLNPLEFISLQNNWFEKVESSSLRALDGQLVIDDLLEELNGLELCLDSSYIHSGQMMEANALQVDMDFEEQLPSSVYSYLFDSLLKKSFSSYSAWTTRGSERVQSCLFTVQGLPSISGVSAMMDGQWSQWGWPQTYVLNNSVLA